jgi:hypothetical protein
MILPLDPTIELVKKKNNVVKKLSPNGRRCDLTVVDPLNRTTILVHRIMFVNESPKMTELIASALPNHQVTIPGVSALGLEGLVAYLYRLSFTASIDEWELLKAFATEWDLFGLSDAIAEAFSALEKTKTTTDEVLDPSVTITVNFESIPKDLSTLSHQQLLSDVEFVLEGSSLMLTFCFYALWA